MLRRWRWNRRFGRAEKLEAQGRRPEARAEFLALAETASGASRATALARAASCATWAGDFMQARQLFQAARDAEPGNADHWLNYANACHRLGDGIGADEAYVEALKRAPDRPDILFYQSVYYADKLTSAGFQGARRAMRRLIEWLKRPGGIESMTARGFPLELPLAFLRNLALEKEKGEDGLAALTEFADPGAGAESPSVAWVRPAALNHRGLLQANLGRYDDAVRDLEASLAIHPSDAALFNLGMAHVRRHDWTQARTHLALYAKRHPTSPIATFGMAMLEETRGQAAEAVRLYEFFLQRQERAPVPPSGLVAYDVGRNWVRHARTFVEAMKRPPEGGSFEAPPEGTFGEATDRPRGTD